ncbi:hypothetical protein LTR36_007282 [Oleoguttula mirabilis]|uniref:Uncharacterized protein n=1 Tax=Oleoguttula mirabilis TaxID=1507867 RepID=A0AAV9JAH3_9PEZI|nr:hypothetical protein LTR36_007282 [Oleoguttula mirabilis]
MARRFHPHPEGEDTQADAALAELQASIDSLKAEHDELWPGARAAGEDIEDEIEEGDIEYHDIEEDQEQLETTSEEQEEHVARTPPARIHVSEALKLPFRAPSKVTVAKVAELRKRYEQ